MWIGGVRVIVLDEKDSVLLVRQQHDGKEIWMVPGGGIEEGESAVDAAVREVKEETGLDIEPGKMLWHIEEVSERGQRFVNFFMARIVGGTLALGEDPEFDDDHQVLREVRFMSRREMAELPHLYPEILREEFWETIEGGLKHDAFKMRETRSDR